MAQLLRPYLTGCESLVLAVSGGPDSVALMGLAARFAAAEPASARLTVATVDHGLRSGSAAEAEAVAGWARRLGLPHRILNWLGAKPATRIQERARDARYRLLFDLAREIGAERVLTAHHLDDQAETVLMRLVAGSGIDGLAGMPQLQPHGIFSLCRPFLAVPKARLVATCVAEGWEYLHDPSNGDQRFGRTRIRNGMAELIRQGLTPQRLTRLAARAGRAGDALETLASAALVRLVLSEREGQLVLDGATLAQEPEEIALRVLRLAIEMVAPEGPRSRLSRLERLGQDVQAALQGRGGGKATLGGVVCEVRADGRIILRREKPRRARARQP